MRGIIARKAVRKVIMCMTHDHIFIQRDGWPYHKELKCDKIVVWCINITHMRVLEIK
jgi:hypothetical protein